MSLRCTEENKVNCLRPTFPVAWLLVYHPRFEPVDFADLCAGRLKILTCH